MLTPPEWQTVWLKSQYSSSNISRKIMFSKTADKILDDLSKCCSSTSKQLTLEALKCWRIWIENQQIEDWKQNDTCYSAVRPLLTKKFHPLHKDAEVSETKLNLMWLALHKIQNLMHLEGPQHILEVFIQSCLSWLSCCEDIDPHIQNLIIKLLASLFTRNVEIEKGEKFPALINNVLQSDKLFCRYLMLFLEIFHNWTKMKEKADLLIIWSNFLGHCEQSFKLIPVAAWHKIFKLVETISSIDNELIKNKLAFLHKCAISLKSVMSNSKFIDCGQLLTPGEVLMKIVVDLCSNNREEDISNDVFQYSREICRGLGAHIIHTIGYESCINTLLKIEDIDSKPLLWGLWCGLTQCFRDQVNNVNIEEYNKIELKMFRKLRSVAVNFDLDSTLLEKESVLTVQDQLNFLRVPSICKNCSANNSNPSFSNVLSESYTKSQLISSDLSDNYIEIEYDENHKFSDDSRNKQSGIFDACGCYGTATDLNVKKNFTNKTLNKLMVPDSKDRTLLQCYISSDKSNKLNLIWIICDSSYERLIRINCDRSVVFASSHLTMLLDEVCNKKSRSKSDLSTRKFIESIKKIKLKVQEGSLFAPFRFFLSFRGKKGVDLYLNMTRFCDDLDEIVLDLGLKKDLNDLVRKSDESLVWFSMFLILVNFLKNLFFQDKDNYLYERKRCDLQEGIEESVVTLIMNNFMKKVIECRSRFSVSDFLDNVSICLPKYCDFPLVFWKNYISTQNGTLNERENKVTRCTQVQQQLNTTENRYGHEDFVNIFKYFDEMQKKIEKNQSPTSIASNTKVENDIRLGRKCSSRLNKSCFRRLNFTPFLPEIPERCDGEAECENVRVLRASRDVFRSLSLSEWVPKASSRIRARAEKETPPSSNKATTRKTRKRKPEKTNTDVLCENESSLPRKRRRKSSENYEKARKVICDKISNDKQNENNEKTKIKKKRDEAVKKALTPCICSRSKENLYLSPSAAYFLRKRPLQRPSKFKDQKCLFTDDSPRKRRSFGKVSETDSLQPENITPIDYNSITLRIHDNNIILPLHEESTNTNTKPLTPESTDVVLPTTSETPKVDEKLMHGDILIPNLSTTDEEASISQPSIKMDIQDFDVELSNVTTESDETSNTEVITMVTCSEVKGQNDSVCDNENNPAHENVTSKLEVKQEQEIDIMKCGSPVSAGRNTGRGQKRSAEEIEIKPEKKIKLEEETYTVTKSVYEESETEAGDVTRTEPTEASPTKKTTPVPDVPIIQNRGSLMLALIPESPKINGYHDSSPRHQRMRPPNVQRNSRASKMLALLPERQENSNGDENAAEAVGEKQSPKEGINSHSIGKIHHLMPSINTSPVRGDSLVFSPLRQKKSIRFDDDLNETVTFYTDSPPCRVVEEGARLRGLEK